MTGDELLDLRYSAGVQSKARRMSREPGTLIREDGVENELWHVVSDSGQRYRVQVIGGWVADVGAGVLPFITCNCPNGMNKGGEPSCWHSAAVMIRLADVLEENPY